MDTPKMNPVIIKLIYKVLTDPTNCYSFTNKDRRAFDDNDKDIANVGAKRTINVGKKVPRYVKSI